MNEPASFRPVPAAGEREAGQRGFIAAVEDDPDFAAAVRRFLGALSGAFRELTDEHRERMAAFGRAIQAAPSVVHPEPGDRAGMLAEIDTLGPVGMLVMVDAIRAEAGGGWWTTRGWLADEYVAAVRPLTVLYDENDEPTTVAAAVAAVRADLAARERQIAAVEQALDVEGWVIERGAHDRGVQLACQRIRRALADPESFLNPTPAAAVRSATKEDK